jgi:alkenylglycerophosphocholine/alkenylglycerophosphoethanolamine hydrolase
LGAASFFISDSILAWNKFVTPLSRASFKVMVTYHLGQILIALGAATQFMK